MEDLQCYNCSYVCIIMETSIHLKGKYASKDEKQYTLRHVDHNSYIYVHVHTCYALYALNLLQQQKLLCGRCYASIALLSMSQPNCYNTFKITPYYTMYKH